MHVACEAPLAMKSPAELAEKGSVFSCVEKAEGQHTNPTVPWPVRTSSVKAAHFSNTSL